MNIFRSIMNKITGGQTVTAPASVSMPAGEQRIAVKPSPREVGDALLIAIDGVNPFERTDGPSKRPDTYAPGPLCRIRAVAQREGKALPEIQGIATFTPVYEFDGGGQKYHSRFEDECSFSKPLLLKLIPGDRWNEVKTDLELLAGIFTEDQRWEAIVVSECHNAATYNRLIEMDRTRALAEPEHYRAWSEPENRLDLSNYVAGLIKSRRAEQRKVRQQYIEPLQRIGQWMQGIINSELDAVILKELDMAINYGVPFAPSFLLKTLWSASEQVQCDINTVPLVPNLNLFWGVIPEMIQRVKG